MQMIKRIREIAKIARAQMEGGLCPRCHCFDYTEYLVSLLYSRCGIEAQHVIGVVLYDDYYRGDKDAWGNHQWAMVGDVLVDISGDQFSIPEDDGYVPIRGKRRIPKVNVIPWSKASGGRRPVYAYEESGPHYVPRTCRMNYVRKKCSC